MICVKPHRYNLVNLRYLSTSTLLDNDLQLPVFDQDPIDASILPILFRVRSQLQYCATNILFKSTKSCHTQLITLGLQSDTLTSNILIKTYHKCGSLHCARQLFDQMSDRTLITWNTMIGVYTQSGQADAALHLFTSMLKHHSPSEFTLSSVLCACAAQSTILECRQLHTLALKTAILANVYVGTALLDVYSKCDRINEARLVFESVVEKSDVTWSSMVAGFVRNEMYEEALILYHRSHHSGVKQNKFTISSVLSACAGLAGMTEGKQLHGMVCKVGLELDMFVASSLVDLYSKCGCVREGYRVFGEQTDAKNVVMWNALISGLARHGGSLGAMVLFEKMQQAGIKPNEVTYVSVLSACAHMGMVKEGRRYFELMVEEHNVRRNAVHYSCMVDLLGRSGLVQEAYEVIVSMPCAATGSVWGSLLAACRKCVNVELAEVAARELFELEPGNPGNHVLLSETYAAGRKWGEVARSRRVLRELGGKEKGVSWIEVRGRVYKFMAGERENPRIKEVYEKVEELVGKVRELGYEVKVEFEFHDVEDGRKEELLRYHGEKLALAFGLICLPDDAAVRIMKNLRICGDCHLFMKFASRVIGREIVVRDVNRFHHFSDGFCSCGDFW